MNASEYLQWYFLIYLLPGGVSLLLLVLSVLGGAHHHGGGHGHGPTHSLGGPHAAGHHPSAGHHSSAGPHPHAAGKPPPPERAATGRPRATAFLGGGRVPITLVWGSLLLGWGLFGFWATRLLEPALHTPVVFGLPVLGLAALGALGTARGMVALWTRLLPPEESFATGTVELCGLMGQVAYPVDTARGRVHVYDSHGTMHDVSARVAVGQAAVGRGRRVLVTDYDAARGFVVVEELP